MIHALVSLLSFARTVRDPWSLEANPGNGLEPTNDTVDIGIDAAPIFSCVIPMDQNVLERFWLR